MTDAQNVRPAEATARGAVPARSVTTCEERVDARIRAIGTWNKQAAERNITRRNGYASYSLLKIMLARDIGL